MGCMLLCISLHLFAASAIQGPLKMQHGAVLGVREAVEELRGEEERPRGAAFARRVRHALEDLPLVPLVHALVDLVHDAEGRAGELLEGDEVEHRG